MTALRIVVLMAVLAIPLLSHAQTVYYLSPVQGSGTETDPYRARNAATWHECVELPDWRGGSARPGPFMLCESLSVPVGGIPLPPDMTSVLTAVQRAAVQALLGRAVPTGKVFDLLADVIDANKIPMRKFGDGRNHLILKGKDVWSRPAPIAWGEIYRDALRFPVVAMHALFDAAISAPLAFAASLTTGFTCANSVSLDCNGLDFISFSGGGWGITSNQAVLNNSVVANLERVDTNLATNNMLVGATICGLARNSATEATVGVLGRKEASATQTYYYAVGKDTATTDEFEFGYVVGASRTALGTSSVDTPGVGDLLELIIDDDQISVRVNGIVRLGPTTNTSVSSDFRQAGIRAFGSGTADNSVCLDDWYAYDVGGASAAQRRVQ